MSQTAKPQHWCYHAPLGKLFIEFNEGYLKKLFWENQLELAANPQISDTGTQFPYFCYPHDSSSPSRSSMSRQAEAAYHSHGGFHTHKNLSYSPVVRDTFCWLDTYFSGKIPQDLPPLKPEGSIFKLQVWELLLQIPYGETTSYGAIAKEIARKRQIQHMSAQAVGSAIGRNPIGIIIPCHRVINSNGNIGGFSAGLSRKKQLLELEKISLP